jgi:hypothetical protein
MFGKKTPQKMIASVGVFCLVMAGAAGLVVPLAMAADETSILSCSGQPKTPITFQIDCSHVKNDTDKKLCAPFLKNQACKVFSAYREITGIKFEATCPAIKYTIYEDDNWPHGKGEGGLALHCAIDYLAEYSIRTKSKIGAYDTHELLHEYQEVLGALPYQHILFGPSQAEAMRLIGDVQGYQKAVERLREDSATFEERFQKLGPKASIDKCTFAEIEIEQSLYLDKNDNVYQFYRKLVRSRIAAQADRETRFNRMYEVVGGDKARRFLLAHGCASF